MNEAERNLLIEVAIVLRQISPPSSQDAIGRALDRLMEESWNNDEAERIYHGG